MKNQWVILLNQQSIIKQQQQPTLTTKARVFWLLPVRSDVWGACHWSYLPKGTADDPLANPHSQSQMIPSIVQCTYYNYSVPLWLDTIWYTARNQWIQYPIKRNNNNNAMLLATNLSGIVLDEWEPVFILKAIRPKNYFINYMWVFIHTMISCSMKDFALNTSVKSYKPYYLITIFKH